MPVFVFFLMLCAARVAAVLVVVLPLDAFAQTADAVTVAPSPSIAVNVGAIVTAVLAWGRDIVLAVLGLVVAKVAPAAVRQWLTNHALEVAVDYAIGVVEGATKGKVLTIPVASQVLTAAAAYVQAQWPAIASRLGPALKAALLARVVKLGAVPEASAARVADLPAQLGVHA